MSDVVRHGLAVAGVVHVDASPDDVDEARGAPRPRRCCGTQPATFQYFRPGSGGYAPPPRLCEVCGRREEPAAEWDRLRKMMAVARWRGAMDDATLDDLCETMRVLLPDNRRAAARFADNAAMDDIDKALAVLWRCRAYDRAMRRKAA